MTADENCMDLSELCRVLKRRGRAFSKSLQ
jgi:hypothetical protein